MQVLRSKLYELELEKRREGAAELEATKQDIAFGSQIRNYVLHPYRLVKDTRTKFERTDSMPCSTAISMSLLKNFWCLRKSDQADS